jgi:glutamate dehydrogenase/leucine dehydrogenase
MISLLSEYKSKKPEIVFEWCDAESEAVGWVVINSLRGGAAGGGTRLRKGLSKEEVISLAKTMEIKFSVAGPNIGGAKSGINFDPHDPRKNDVLKRWYKAVLPLLKHYYGTGGDLNVDELRDVVPITEDLGLWHPQEGIVNGHFQHATVGEHIRILGQLRHGVSKIVEDADYIPDSPKKYAVADMITGFGVAESVKHYYQIFRNEDLKGKKAIIQGWGNVASTAACYLALQGVQIVGIIDREGGLFSEKGFNLTEIKKLFTSKDKNKLVADNIIPFEQANELVWSLGAEIFVPGAASKLITRTQIDLLIQNGLEVIACGANVPFIDDDVFFGETAFYTDTKVSLIPDFIANCGMARTFAYLMQPNVELTDKAIFEDVSQTIKKALEETHKKSSSTTALSKVSLEIALNKLLG